MVKKTNLNVSAPPPPADESGNMKHKANKIRVANSENFPNEVNAINLLMNWCCLFNRYKTMETNKPANTKIQIQRVKPNSANE